MTFGLNKLLPRFIAVWSACDDNSNSNSFRFQHDLLKDLLESCLPFIWDM